VQSERLKTTSRYGPMPMGEILDIAERLRWAAQEAIRVSPYLNERLSPGEAGSCTTSRDEAVA
jgi:hypothetical protein